MAEFDMSLVQRGARNRRTPYHEAEQRYGPKGYTVYNHMYFPIRFDTFEAEFTRSSTTSPSGMSPSSAASRSVVRTASGSPS
jgi:hypothetical protein